MEIEYRLKWEKMPPISKYWAEQLMDRLAKAAKLNGNADEITKSDLVEVVTSEL